jgi:hypothetical protein
MRHLRRMGAAIALGLLGAFAGQRPALAEEPGEQLCQSGAANPGSGEWGRGCFGTDWGYAEVRVTTDNDHHDFSVHVTDHQTCTNDSVTECEVYTGEFETRVFREGNYDYSEDGWFPMFLLTCYCAL